MKRSKYTPSADEIRAREEKRAKLRELARLVSIMPEDERQRFIQAHPVHTCAGRILSPFNQCFAIMQNPQASMVGGFRQWLKVGRHVRKGERGLSIWVPTSKRGETSADDGSAPVALALDDIQSQELAMPGAAEGETTTRGRSRFVLATVFDVMQTAEKSAEISAEASEGGGAE